MDKKNAEVAPPTQEVKHMSIVHATGRLDAVRDRLLGLFERITGESSPRCEDCEATNPSLKQVLENSGNAVAKLAEEINEIITSIESELF